MVALLLRACLDLGWGSLLAACFAGACSDAPRLRRIAMRESGGNPFVGVHEHDARWSDVAYSNAVRVRYIDPRCQGRRPRAWATRGVHGLFAAYSTRHLWRCADPAWLDVPLFSALAAARRMRSRACRSAPRCRSWAA